jgi:hypothetical protein
MLTDEQIKFIHQDISRRGITIEDLRDNITDHVCCILESEMTDSDDFIRAYERIIRMFYKDELKELESETILLLTSKYYYAMKKIMIYTGSLTVTTLVAGSFFKIMHWPGAGILIAFSLLTACLIFLPLLYFMRIKENTSTGARLTVATGVITAILFCIGVLFKVQHWPGANILWLSSFLASFLIFTPVYFFSNIKFPEKRINTIITTVLIIIATGVQFALININPSINQARTRTYTYLQGEMLLDKMKSHYNPKVAGDNVSNILNTTEEIKQLILQTSIGYPKIPSDFEEKKIYLNESSLGNAFITSSAGYILLTKLQLQLNHYNSLQPEEKRISITNTIPDAINDNISTYSNTFALTSLTQLEICLLSGS